MEPAHTHCLNPEVCLSVEEIAKKRGISMAQVAIAWSLAKDGVTAPIIGTTSLNNLKDIIGAHICMQALVKHTN